MAETHLADLTLYEGHIDEAAELLEASRGRARAFGWRAGETAGCVNLARARLLQGHVHDASVALRDAAAIEEFPQLLPGWLEAAAAAVHSRGDHQLASALFGAAIACREETGAVTDPLRSSPVSRIVEPLAWIIRASFDPMRDLRQHSRLRTRSQSRCGRWTEQLMSTARPYAKRRSTRQARRSRLGR